MSKTKKNLTTITVSAAALAGVATVGAVNTNSVHAAETKAVQSQKQTAPATVDEAAKDAANKKQDLSKSQEAS